MNIKNLLSLIFLSLIVISCSRNQESEIKPENQPVVSKMGVSVLYPGALPFQGAEMTFKFNYDFNQRLTKKIGGFISSSGSTGLQINYFTDKIHTNLSYDNNKVTVEDLSTATDFTVPKNTKYFTLNSQFQIIEKEIPNSSFYWYKKQTFVYKSDILDEIKTTLPNMPFDPTDPNDYIETYSEKFFYDSKGNLTKTEYFEEKNGVKSENKIIRYFENYDESYNPFKRFTLLDDYFYRSLSKNNFRTYREEKSMDGNTNTFQQDWGFNYDANGQIIIN